MKHTVAVVSTAVPPSASGQAKALERLLRDRADTDYVFFSDNYLMWPEPHAQTMGRYVPLSFQRFGVTMREIPGVLGRINVRLGVDRPIRQRADEIVSALADTPPSLVLGCSGNPFDLPASARAAEILGAPFIAYLFDDPIYQNPVGQTRDLAMKFEASWSQTAVEIICPNEALAEEIFRRTGRRCRIIRNPSVPAVRQDTKKTSSSARAFRIVYTGSVYEAQADSLARLADIANSQPADLSLEIYSPQPTQVITNLGICGAAVSHYSHVSDAEIAEVRFGADVLFLPLAFADAMRPIVDTASPGKIADYLMSDVPILVHSPRGSYLSEFFRLHDAGQVIDDPSTEELAKGVQLLTRDRGRAAQVRKNASIAAELFDPIKLREEFWGVMKPIMASSSAALNKRPSILLIGPPHDRRVIRWAESLARSPWKVSLFSSDADSPGLYDGWSLRRLAKQLERQTFSPHTPDEKSISLLHRLARAVRLAAQDSRWAARRIIHGPVASLGRHARDSRGGEFVGVYSEESRALGAGGGDVRDPGPFSLAAALMRTIGDTPPQIIHSMDDVSSSVVQLMKTQFGDLPSVWLVSNWGLPSHAEWEGRRLIEPAPDSSPAVALGGHDRRRDGADEADIRVAGLSALLELRPPKVREMTHRLYRRFSS